jgi:hypothetical protein
MSFRHRLGDPAKRENYAHEPVRQPTGYPLEPGVVNHIALRPGWKCPDCRLKEHQLAPCDICGRPTNGCCTVILE